MAYHKLERVGGQEVVNSVHFALVGGAVEEVVVAVRRVSLC